MMNVTTTGEEIAVLKHRIAELERVVAILARERDMRQPYASPGVPTPMWPVYPAPTANTCARCGLKLEGVMGYVCPNGGNCPTGLGGAVCMA